MRVKNLDDNKKAGQLCWTVFFWETLFCKYFPGYDMPRIHQRNCWVVRLRSSVFSAIVQDNYIPCAVMRLIHATYLDDGALNINKLVVTFGPG